MEAESKIRKIINSLAANEEIVVVTLYQSGFLLGNMPQRGPFTSTHFMADDFGDNKKENSSSDKPINIGTILRSIDLNKNNHELTIEVAPKRNFIYTPAELQSFLNRLIPDMKPQSHHNAYGENTFKIYGDNFELGSLLYTEKIGKKSIDYLVKSVIDDPELKILDCFVDGKANTYYQQNSEIFRYIHLALYPDPLLARISPFSYNLNLEAVGEYKKLIGEKNKTRTEIISILSKLWSSSRFSILAKSKYSQDQKNFEEIFGPYLKLIIGK